MRCYCCDVILTPQESTRRFAQSKEFTDMCNSCLNTIDVETVDSDVQDDEEYE